MSLTAAVVRPADALGELARAIAQFKGDDRLVPVTVIVPTNTSGVMARRALGRRSGIVGVDMVTLNRLAELIAGPALAAAGRSPMSSSVVDLAIGSALHSHPGSFRAVATHPSTVVALRHLHDELRRAGPTSLDRLAEHSSRGREAVRVSRAVTADLEADWYDEGDLYSEARRVVGSGDVAELPNVVVHLPHNLSELALGFVRSLAARVDVHLVVEQTGQRECDVESLRLLDALGIDTLRLLDALGLDTPGPVEMGLDTRSATTSPTRPVRIISTTDADDEVRIATRVVLDAARTGTPFERVAVLWPTQRPYARLVEHHLTAAGIRWNGRPGTAITERLAPRLVLDLLDVDRRGLRRRSLFALVADVPPSGADGGYLPTAAWERVSREAGVARDDDWGVRLGALAGSERWGGAATSLLDFVDDLRTALGPPSRTRRWWDWAEWCVEQLDRWVGLHRLERLPEVEYRAWEALMKALDRLRRLDPVGEPVTRRRFRAALEAELDSMPGRIGRVGDGVTVGSLAGAVGLDVDVAIVLGASEGSLPPPAPSDPLLSDADRAAAGLPRSDTHTTRLHHLLIALGDTADVTLTLPRGDLRSTAHGEPSRWLDRWAGRSQLRTVDSHTAGLSSTEFPSSPTEHRLRARYAHVRSGEPLISAAGVGDDTALVRGLALVAGRSSDTLTIYDGDLSAAGVPPIGAVVSPTQLETWSSCPHAYFVRYLLGVRPIDEPDDAISITALDRGSTHHVALDRFHRAVIAGELPQPSEHGWNDAHRAALSALFDDECERTQRRGRTGRRASWSDEQERMRSDLLGWLDHDSEISMARGSTVIASEHRFGSSGQESEAADVGIELDDGRRISLRGSVDRIDRTASGTIVVTDHKTGAAGSYKDLGPDDPTLGGSVFQLPAYAAAARALVGESAVDVITEYGLMAKGGYQRPGYTLTPAVAATVAAQLAHVVRGIEAGYFPHLPQRPGWRQRVECDYCEPDHLGTADRWADWARKRHDPRLAPWFGPVPEPSDE